MPARSRQNAIARARGYVVGALVFACAVRLAVLGEDFEREGALIRERLRAPIGGTCVYGEIAKTERDVVAVFNSTTVVVAFAG